MTTDWRSRGIRRLTIELPADLWERIAGEAERLCLTPSAVIRSTLAERFPAQAAAPREPQGDDSGDG